MMLISLLTGASEALNRNPDRLGSNAMRRPPIVAILLPSLLGIVSADPPPLRQPNPQLNVPAFPPATHLQLVNAFPGVTFSQAVCIASPPGDPNRLFVCERTGKIWLIPDVTASSPV